MARMARISSIPKLFRMCMRVKVRIETRIAARGKNIKISIKTPLPCVSGLTRLAVGHVKITAGGGNCMFSVRRVFEGCSLI
jgi:hypothetical protein